MVRGRPQGFVTLGGFSGLERLPGHLLPLVGVPVFETAFAGGEPLFDGDVLLVAATDERSGLLREVVADDVSLAVLLVPGWSLTERRVDELVTVTGELVPTVARG